MAAAGGGAERAAERRAVVRGVKQVRDPAARYRQALATRQALDRELRAIQDRAVLELAEQLGPKRVGGPRRKRNWTAAAEQLGVSKEWARKRGMAALHDGHAGGEAPDAG